MTKKEYSELILKLYHDNSKLITKKDIINAKDINEKGVYKYFGSFQDMCEELNLITTTPKRRSKKEVKEILIDIYNEYGKVTTPIIREVGLTSTDTIKRLFGSLSNAYIECGIPLQYGQRKFVEKDEIVKEIFRLNNEYGYVSKPMIEKHSSYNPKIVQRIFGSFNNMYDELGITSHKSGRIPTDAELIDECKRIYDTHEFLSYDLIEKFGNISTTCFKDRASKNNWNGINYYREQIDCEIPALEWGESPSAKLAINKFSKYLNEIPIKEKKFDWLINKKLKNPKQSPLRIDAYFPKANIAVEYNGPQHYFVDGTYTKTEDDLANRIYLDALKADLIKKHGIQLIVIHYKDKVTDDYIQNAISNNSETWPT